MKNKLSPKAALGADIKVPPGTPIKPKIILTPKSQLAFSKNLKQSPK
jgi:hypothetical protein